jgi:tetratricopeptide (TPR) repeat protein
MMLQTDRAARQRFAMLGGVVFLLLGGMTLYGLVQRFVPNPSEGAEDQLHASVVADARRARQIRRNLSDLGRKGQWQAVIEAADASQKEKPFGLVRGLRAEALLLSGDWEAARNEFKQLLDVQEAVIRASWYQYADDPAGYRRYCEKMLAPVEVDKMPTMHANSAAWMCSMGPNALEDYTKARQLAEKAVAEADPGAKPSYLNTLGALLYRMGSDQEAIDRLMEAEKIESNAFNWPFLAMAHQRLGHREEALRWRTRLDKRVQDTFATLEQQDSRHELLLFQRETQQIVK